MTRSLMSIRYKRKPYSSSWYFALTIINEKWVSNFQVLLHLDPKEFTVEPSTLQSLQQLIQWVADLALNLLARLPEQRLQMKSGGVSI